MTSIDAARKAAPIFPLVVKCDAIRIADERARDHVAREQLLDACFGEERFAKTCERLREGRLPARHLALIAKDKGVSVGTLRFWHVRAGDVDALLLGPLAVAPSHRERGLGGALMRTGLARARALGHKAVLLVGDEPYYNRFGFSRALAERLDLPGFYEPSRFLAHELVQGALAPAQGMVQASGCAAGMALSRAA
jgi:predicted N-acetyltransferase YhbS